jgi:hypothetical protein
VKNKGSTTSSQSEPIDLNNPPQTQQEVGYLNQQPFSDSAPKKYILPTMGTLYMGHLE